MSEFFIPLHLTPGINGVYIRNLCGTDELSVESKGLSDVLNFLDSLIIKDGNGKKINASEIVTADRDRLIAMLYISLYGHKIESTLICKNCDQKFDLDFSLYDLLNHYKPDPLTVTQNGTYEVESGINFRFPTGEDEKSVIGLSQSEAEKMLLGRCLLKGNPESNNEKVQLKMAEIAPVLNIEMQATCPECNYSQETRFDIQSFFLMKLILEKTLLIREIHYIASKYNWSLNEIVSLPRNLRKKFAALIQSEN